MQPEWLRSGPLLAVLGKARELGFLGPGPVEDHAQHSLGFLRAAGEEGPGLAVDLGSGGGVPGLLLALAWPESRVVLLDASERRTNFLAESVGRLGLSTPRVMVLRGRAEEVGRQDHWRGAADLVVARAFGPPAVVAECGAPLLKQGGRLIVSEPPGGGFERWPQPGVEMFGLVAAAPDQHEGGWYRVLTQQERCPDRFPRRSGVPAKRPRF